MTTHEPATRLIPVGDTPRPGEPRIPIADTTISIAPATPLRLPHPSVAAAGLSLLTVSRRLMPRDYTLALLLDEHGVLTTPQITAILFNSTFTCRNRLHVLRRIGFLDRFVPHRPGIIFPIHWIAGLLATRYSALSQDKRPPSPKTLRERQDALVASPQLRHRVGANQFFTDLLAYARTQAGCGLLRWWPEGRTSAAFGRRVRPDGYGVWSEGGALTGFWLEHDNNTESLGRLLSKVDAYRRLHAAGAPRLPVLFWLPTAARETNLHKRLAGVSLAGVTVATAARDTTTHAGQSPADAVWRLAGNGRHRLRLADLPSAPGTPGAYNPGPPTAEDDPLRLLHD